jgi:hypothetical protein
VSDLWENGYCRAASPVKIFQALVSGLGWTGVDRGYGGSMRGSLARYDRDSRSWKTSATSLFADLTECWGVLPRSGMMQSGRIYAPAMWERPIAGVVSGLSPTPPPPTVVKYPTPTTHGLGGGSGACKAIDKLYRAGKITVAERHAMRSGNGGRLNPEWVEWLMGYPTGWTDLSV